MSRFRMFVTCVWVMFFSCLFSFQIFTFDKVLSIVLPDYVHCNSDDEELWIVEDRSSGKIWQASDGWYLFVCKHLSGWGPVSGYLLLGVVVITAVVCYWWWDFEEADVGRSASSEGSG